MHLKEKFVGIHENCFTFIESENKILTTKIHFPQTHLNLRHNSRKVKNVNRNENFPKV